MPAVMSPTQEYPVTSQVAPTYGRNPGDVSADLLVFYTSSVYYVLKYSMAKFCFKLNQARKAELDRRQAELDKREEELRNASTNGTCYLLFIFVCQIIKTNYFCIVSASKQLATIT